MLPFLWQTHCDMVDASLHSMQRKILDTITRNKDIYNLSIPVSRLTSCLSVPMSRQMSCLSTIPVSRQLSCLSTPVTKVGVGGVF